MISTLIVVSAIVLAAGFSFAWLVRRDLREQIERPKHEFQNRLREYDRQYNDDSDNI